MYWNRPGVLKVLLLPFCGSSAACARPLASARQHSRRANGRRDRGPRAAGRGTALAATLVLVLAPALAACSDDSGGGGEVDPAAAGLLGCGVMAGYGAAAHTGQIGEGRSIAVFGCGGVGISAIQGARVAGDDSPNAPHPQRHPEGGGRG